MVPCPRCMRRVLSIHGTCSHCGENVLQCPNCRNVNYDKPDALICGECGHCRFGKVEIFLTMRTGFATDTITCERDKEAMVKAISTGLALALRSHETLEQQRVQLAALIRSPAYKTASKAGKYIEIYDTYMSKCVSEYKKMIQQIRSVNAMKSELLQYATPESKQPKWLTLEPSQSCYGCAEMYLLVFLKFIELAAQIPGCTQFYSQGELYTLFVKLILPNASSAVAKLVVRALVALAAQEPAFSKVLLGRVGEQVREANTHADPETQLPLQAQLQTRHELALSVELLLLLHSKLLFIVTVQDGSTYHRMTYSKTNACMWETFASCIPIRSRAIADVVLQPILDYALLILSLPCPRELVPFPPMLVGNCFGRGSFVGREGRARGVESGDEDQREGSIEESR
jgi:hypothetical protein